MMIQVKRRKFLAGLLCGLIAATPAAAQDHVEDIVSQLREQGFSNIQQESTLLGRVRIMASSGDGQREIILNPHTGEILRDLWIPAEGSTRKIAIIDDTGTTSGTGSSGTGTSSGSGSGSGVSGDDDDEVEDEEEEEDEQEDEED
jgi:hypothetical protein